MKIARRQFALIIAVVLALVGFVLFIPQANAAPPKQQPPEKLSAVDGESLFTQNCVPCHGSTGKGDGPTAASIDQVLPDFTNPATLNALSPSEIFTVVKEGRMDRMMPPWKNKLNDEQIWAAVAYLLTLNAPEDVIQSGEAVYSAACASCHNAGGVSADVDLTAPTTWINVSTDALLTSFASSGNAHQPVLQEQSLGDAEVVSALAYARSLSMDLPVPVSRDGVLTGKVVNATTGEPMPNLGLILYVLSNDGNILDTITGSSAEDGTYKFENLQREHTVTFVVEAVYEDIQYYSDETAVFVPDSKETTLDVNVYETTDDPSVISATTLHRLIAFVPGAISITDIYVYQNSSDKTFIGTPGADGLPETVKFAVPADAQNISLQFDTSRQIDDTTYVESRPVIPGKRDYSVAVSYNIPINGRTAEVKTTLMDDIPVVNLLMAGQGAELSSAQLQREQDRTIQGQTYQQFSGSNLPAGEELRMTFKGLNKLDFGNTGMGGTASSAISAGPSQQTLMYGILALGVLVIGFMVFVANRSQPAYATVETLAAQKERLVALLNELELMHESGDIDHTTYRQLRAQYREELKGVLAQAHD